tara:strand:+ start:583 stop:816 length:234 start_codon:yes stop_codon:yes gene_type:complete
VAKNKTEEYRNKITVHLTRMSSDIEHIKEKVNENNEHLIRLNGRVRENEKQISWIKGIGVMFVFCISSLITWLGIDK